MIEAKVKWIANMQFVGKVTSSRFIGAPTYDVLMDSSSAVRTGFKPAPTPMEFLLIALGGCTGMDVVSILRKMKVEFDSIEIGISGERASEHPKVYRKIELVYKVKCHSERSEESLEDKVKRAVELSQEKYCSISAMLKPKAEISYRIEIRE